MIFIPDQSIIRMGIRDAPPAARRRPCLGSGRKSMPDRSRCRRRGGSVRRHSSYVRSFPGSPEHALCHRTIYRFHLFWILWRESTDHRATTPRASPDHFPQEYRCMSLGDHCHPGFFIHRQHVEFLCVIRGRDHGNLTQSLCYACYSHHLCCRSTDCTVHEDVSAEIQRSIPQKG